MIPRTGARLRDHPRRAKVSTTGAGAGFTNLNTPSKVRNAITSPLITRPATRAFFETGAVCVSDGMSFSPYIVQTKNRGGIASQFLSRNAKYHVKSGVRSLFSLFS